MDAGHYIFDPHFAIGVTATHRSICRTSLSEMQHIAVATVHPAQSATAVENALEVSKDFQLGTLLSEQFVALDKLRRRMPATKNFGGIEELKRSIKEQS